MTYDFSTLDSAVQTARASMETAAEAKDVDNFKAASETYYAAVGALFDALNDAVNVVKALRREASAYLGLVTDYDALIDKFDGEDEET